MTASISEICDHFTGDATGLVVPAHGAALRAGGAAWLTSAFRSFGSLGADNAVSRIVSFEACPGGSTGAKFYLNVEYAHPVPGLHTRLFVKFSRDFTDERRDNRHNHEYRPGHRHHFRHRLARVAVAHRRLDRHRYGGRAHALNEAEQQQRLEARRDDCDERCDRERRKANE